MKKLSVDVIVLTYKPDQKFRQLTEKIQGQTYPVSHMIVINTEEQYWDQDLCRDVPNLKLYHIEKKDFDHGKTRHLAAGYSDADIMVFMTQDAVPADSKLVERLVSGFSDQQVGAVYARQLPAPDCSELEQFTRAFNYPGNSRVKSAADLESLGIKTFFCSNVCAAYRRSCYLELGGFVRQAIFNEDMIFAGKLIKSGYKIRYEAEARVIHSHNYGNIQQLRRNFDIGVSQADHPEVFGSVASESEGIAMVKKTAGHLIGIKKPYLIPDLIIKSGFKYLGYRLGKKYRKLPKRVIMSCTMNPGYWEN